MNCINIKHKDFIKLQKDTNINSMVLEFKVSKWQQKNGFDRFPSKAELMYSDSSKQALLDSITDEAMDDILITKEPITEEPKDYYNANVSALFNGNSMGRFTAKDVLNNLITSNILNDTQIKLVDSLLKGSNAKVKFSTITNKNVPMRYDPLTNTILIDKTRFNSRTPKYISRVFLHEVLHDVTFKALNNPQTFNEKMFSNLMNQEFAKFKELYDVYNKTVQEEPYGFYDVDEFTAELMTNPEFRNILTKLEYNNKNLLQKIAYLIRQLLGLENKSELNDLTESVLTMAEHNTYKGGVAARMRNKIEPDNLELELRTTQNKYDNIIERVKQSLQYNINNFTNIANRVRHYDEAGAKNWDKYINSLSQIKESIEQYKDIEPIDSLTYFIDAMDNSLENVKSRIKDIDYSDTKESIKTYEIYNSYLETYDVINEISDLLSHMKQNMEDNELLSEEDIEGLRIRISFAKTEYDTLQSDFKSIRDKILIQSLNNPLFFPDVVKDHEVLLEKEYRKRGITVDKTKWIYDKIHNRDKDLIQSKLDDKIIEFINNPASDIYGNDVSLSSVTNLSSPLLQIMNTIITNIKNERTIIEREKDLEFKTLYDELVKDRGSNSVTKLYANMLEKDMNGKYHIKGEHSIKLMDKILKFRADNSVIQDEINDTKIELSEIKDKYDINSDEYIDIKNRIIKLTKKRNAAKAKFLNDNFIIENKKIISPKSKWLNDTSNLSETEQKVLNFFVELTEENNKFYNGGNKLVKYQFKTKFYELPKITKSDTERVWNGGVAGIAKDKYAELTEVRPDDIGFTTEFTNVANKRVYRLKEHFRDPAGKFDNASQSLDMMTNMRLDYQAANANRIRKESEPILKMLVDLAKSKDYYEKSGTRDVVNSSTGKLKTYKGVNSNTFKFAENMLETKFYDQLNKNNVKWGKVDANKAVKFFNSATAFMTLSMNIASGTANVVNAQAQLFLESFIKGKYIKAGSIKKANIIYGENLMDTLGDVTNPISESYVNQINEMFDINGLLFLTEANFLKSDIVKKGVSFESLQVFQNTGEHYIQSVITMSVLDGVKVMDANHNLLDKDGNIVDNEKEAASILDMMKKDETGLVQLSDKVVYTTHSKLNTWREGGKSQIDMLIDKKLKDSIGNYKKMDQPELMRHWYGKLFLLFRKYFMAMGQARLRGIETSFTESDKLTPRQKRFSYALQEYEEGTYTTLLRYLATLVKQKKAHLLLTDWKNLSDYEINNIKRSVVEIVMTAGVLPLLAGILAEAAADGDDDKLFFLAYQLKRLDTELSSYRNISEMLKMLRSPIPSTRLLEDTLGILSQLATPWTLGEEYTTGIHKGENKFTTRLKRKIPVLKEFNRQYETLFTFQSRSMGGFGN